MRLNILPLIAIVGTLLPLHATAQTPRRVKELEERAVSILEEMCAAYAALPGYEQKTEFSSAAIPFTPSPTPFGSPTPPTIEPLEEDAPKEESIPDEKGNVPKKKPRLSKTGRSIAITYQPPNLLRVEMEEPNAGQEGASQSRIWVSDGKYFWTTEPGQKVYTKEKTPKTLKAMMQSESLSISMLEIIMLAGINPFENVHRDTDSTLYVGGAVIHAVPCDVVSMKTSDEKNETEVRLFIATSDHLLRRVMIDTTPVAAPLSTGKVGDPLDEIYDNTPPPIVQPISPSSLEENSDLPFLQEVVAPPPATGSGLPFKSRLIYDNIISIREAYPERLFHFEIPQGYGLFTPRNSIDNLKPKNKKYQLMKRRRR